MICDYCFINMKRCCLLLRPTGAKRNESVLVSLGTDGRIFLWVLNLLDLNDFTPSKAFSVSTQDLGRSLPAHSEKSNLRSEVGITAASFSFEHENLFVIGCCGGALLLCSLQPAQEVAPSLQSANEQDLNFATPVQMAYIAHRSTVCCVDFSATGRNLFLSASVDGEMRVYNALDSKPVALMHLEFGLASACFWSRERPVIYCLASGGTVRSIVLIHDGSHQSRLCYSCSPFLTTDEEEVSNLWLNCWKRSSEELALLSARGELSIWKRTN